MKYVYLFKEGNAQMRELLGGKGSNLCQMTRLGLPVPCGFIVTTQTCLKFFETGWTSDIEKAVLKALASVEKQNGKIFGDKNNPLIMSVRSGARVSMPGMMDSVLNLGLNDEIVESFAKTSGNARFVYDCYRRFIQMFSDVVKGVDSSLFEKEIDKMKKQTNAKTDKDFDAETLKKLIEKFKKIYSQKTGEDFPQDVKEELFECVKSVFNSWKNERAITYRKLNNIPEDWGTAVNVQTMVFGNLNDQSGTGVVFSRNPATGENAFYGEYLMNAQGEDIVAGIRTPSPIANLKKQNKTAYEELYGYAKKLEVFYKDMQDMEFTIENGKLFVLQTRNGKRTAKANVKIVYDLTKEKILTEVEAVKKIEIEKINELLHPVLNAQKQKPIASGLPASPGGGVGKIAFTAEKANEFAKNKQKCVLVRFETSPEDIKGMNVAEAIVTARGGMTSHAAVVARGMGAVCVSGSKDIEFVKNKVKIGTKLFAEGDVISVDGTTGLIYEGEIPTTSAKISKEFSELLNFATNQKTLEVRANAETTADVKVANSFGAEGVGLCRTEHMFFDSERIPFMQEMILAKTKEERIKALGKLLVFQKKDFVAIFKEMKGKPVTIRLLDPPLHEFLPKNKKAEFAEVNPMMGHRGLRLAVTYPEIYEMQTRAIIESALLVKEKNKIDVVPEIMIPLTSDVSEFVFVKNIVENVIKAIDKENKLTYKIGTMIETPRAVLLADKLAKVADFFSFGTNDLTQFTFGFSRDDSSKFLSEYYKNNIFESDVFAHIDETGVGEFVKMAVKKARAVNPKISLGVCGEHAGDPKSIEFFKTCGLDYVSCSAYRVPIAKICAIK